MEEAIIRGCFGENQDGAVFLVYIQKWQAVVGPSIIKVGDLDLIGSSEMVNISCLKLSQFPIMNGREGSGIK